MSEHWLWIIGRAERAGGIYRAGGRRDSGYAETDDRGAAWYLAVGYGKQDSSGYSIQVPGFYRTENGLVLDTELLGPETEPTGNGRAPSTPYLVILTEYREEPVTYE